MLFAFLQQISWISFFLGAASVLIILCVVTILVIAWLLHKDITFLD